MNWQFEFKIIPTKIFWIVRRPCSPNTYTLVCCALWHCIVRFCAASRYAAFCCSYYFRCSVMDTMDTTMVPILTTMLWIPPRRYRHLYWHLCSNLRLSSPFCLSFDAAYCVEPLEAIILRPVRPTTSFRYPPPQIPRTIHYPPSVTHRH